MTRRKTEELSQEALERLAVRLLLENASLNGLAAEVGISREALRNRLVRARLIPITPLTKGIDFYVDVAAEQYGGGQSLESIAGGVCLPVQVVRHLLGEAGLWESAKKARALYFKKEAHLLEMTKRKEARDAARVRRNRREKPPTREELQRELDRANEVRKARLTLEEEVIELYEGGESVRGVRELLRYEDRWKFEEDVESILDRHGIPRHFDEAHHRAEQNALLGELTQKVAEEVVHRYQDNGSSIEEIVAYLKGQGIQASAVAVRKTLVGQGVALRPRR